MALLVNSSSKIVGRARKKTKAHEGPFNVVRRIVATVEELLSETKITIDQVSAMGVGCPGAVDMDKGVVLSAPNLGWKALPLKKELEKAFGISVAVLNDVDSGIYGEYRCGAAKGVRTAVGIFPGTGIGGGCVYNGEIIRGKTSSAFEIGHVIVQPHGPLCGCGQRGCLEAVASRLAVSSAAIAAVYRGAAPNLSRIAGLDISKYGSGALAEAIRLGDKSIEDIVKEAGHWIGIGTAMIVNLFLPDVVVLGGGMAEAMPELILRECEKSARKSVLPSFRDSFTISIAKLGDYSGALGAAEWASRK
jgi:glucokinase